MKKVFKWLGILAGGVIGLVLILLGVVYGASEWQLGKSYEIHMNSVSIPNDPISIERGKHLSTAIMKCVDCHGDNLGGKVWVDVPELGRLVAPNLTTGRGGLGTTLTNEDWFRAVRHGVGPDKHGLLMMPSDDFYTASDEEVGAIVAYIKSLPPVDSDLPDHTIRPLGRFLYLIGELPLLPTEKIDHTASRPAAPAAGATAEYGRYISMTGGCIGCHGPALSGGKIPGTPPDWPLAANLTPDQTTGMGKWTETDFFRAMREGKRPDGKVLNELMPWKYTAKMTDDEIRAVWLYLRSIPAKPAGNR